jgi:hypothetical protein
VTRRPHGFGRRRFLASVAALAALAGCGGDGGTAPRSTSDGTTATATTASGTISEQATTDGTVTGGATRTMTTEDLTLSEANVTAVEFERTDGEYRFDVTLYHDDDGEDGYANWWQVETLDGERLGRRDLLHAHGTREFTRSDTVDVGGATCVVVRGHDQTHGYGGQAIVLNLDTGETDPVRQGTEPREFSDYEGIC